VLRAIADLNDRWRVNVLVHTRHAERFNRLLSETAPSCAVRLVQVTDLGVETAIQLKEAIDRGEWVVSVADRIPPEESRRIVRVPFFGEPAAFPQGPFILASLLDAPVSTMFCMRENGTYRVSFEKLAERIDLPRNEREPRVRAFVGQFVTRLEAHVIEAPLHWFNFYDFWSAGAEEGQSLPRSQEACASSLAAGAKLKVG
jgi:predicted LPLAT superfamily acyltransferase